MTYSSTLDLVRGIKLRLAGCGFDVDALFRQADLSEGDAMGGDPLVRSDKLSHLWQLLTKMSGDPLLGLKLSSPQPSGWLGLMSHIMLISPDVKSAIDNLVRYTPLVSTTIHSSIQHVEGRTRLSMHLPAGQRPVPQQRYDFIWCMVLRTLQSAAVRSDLKPLLVTYAFPRPDATQAYEEAFGCTVRFDMPANTMEFADADLLTSIPTGHPTAADWPPHMLAELAQSQREWTFNMLNNMEQSQQPSAGTSFNSRVQSLLASMLPKGEPLREDVAKHLMMSERTLQRRLAEEGTNFTQIVDDTRRELAQQHLNNGQLSFKQLSFQLGFSEPSAFNRACKRGFGRSPSQLQQGPGSAQTILTSPALALVPLIDSAQSENAPRFTVVKSHSNRILK